MENVTRKLTGLFLTRCFWSVGYAFMYSTLSLYLVNRFGYKQSAAATLTATFVGLNYLLPLFGGVLLQKYADNLYLFITCTLFQAIGCALLFCNKLTFLNIGLSFFLLGSVVIITSINVELSQLYSKNTMKRNSVFMANYGGMNFGFFIGYIISGIFTSNNNYSDLFLLAIIPILLSSLVFYLSLKSRVKKPLFNRQRIYQLVILILLVLILFAIFTYYKFFSHILIYLMLVLFCFVLYIVSLKKQSDLLWLKKFILYSIIIVTFWSLYSIIPSSLPLIIDKSVNLNFLGYKLQPQWLLNFNTIVIIIFCPTLAYYYKKKAEANRQWSTLSQLLIALILVSLSMFFIYFGALLPKHHYISIGWIIASLVAISFGEILLTPLTFSLVGEIVPYQFFSLLSGLVMLPSAIGTIFSGHLSNFIFISNNLSLLGSSAINKDFFLLSAIIILLLTFFYYLLNIIIGEKKNVAIFFLYKFGNWYLLNYKGLTISKWSRVGLSFVNAISGATVYFLALYYHTYLHLSVKTATSLVACFGIGAIIGSLSSGRLSNLISFKNLSIFFMIVNAISVFLFAIINSTFGFALNTFIMGASCYGFIVTNTTLLLANETSTAKVKILNFQRMFNNISIGITVFLGGFLFYHSAILIFIVIGSIVLLASMFSFAISDQSLTKSTEAVIKQKNKNKLFLFILFMVFLIGIIISQIKSTYPLYLNHEFPLLGPIAFSIVFFLNTTLVAFLQVPLVSYFSKINKLLLLAVASLFFFIGMLIMGIFKDYSAIIIACIFWTIGEIFFFSLAKYICFDSYSNERKSNISLSYYQMIYSISMIIGPILGGYIYEYFYQGLWIACAFIALFASILLFIAAKSYTTSNKSRIL